MSRRYVWQGRRRDLSREDKIGLGLGAAAILGPPVLILGVVAVVAIGFGVLVLFKKTSSPPTNTGP